MQTLGTAEPIADRLGDPEWVGAAVGATVASTVAAVKALGWWRSRNLDANRLVLDMVSDAAKLATELSDRAVAQMRCELDDMRTKLDETTETLARVQQENAALRSEVTQLRAGEFDRRQHSPGGS